MSDPEDPSQRPLRNPPGARRRGRRARAVPDDAPPADDAPLPLAPGPAPEAPAGTVEKGAAARRRVPAPPPAEKEQERSSPRGMVCRNCGKYHDISTRPVGSQFDCKCGAQLTVPPPREAPITRPAEITLRIRELRSRHRMSMISMLIGFAACIALLSAALYLLVTEQSYVTGTCTAMAALGFLALAVIATNEWRRTSAELAAEGVEDRT